MCCMEQKLLALEQDKYELVLEQCTPPEQDEHIQVGDKPQVGFKKQMKTHGVFSDKS